MWPKFPDICLTVEEKHRKNLNQESDRRSNPGWLRERQRSYHSGGQQPSKIIGPDVWENCTIKTKDKSIMNWNIWEKQQNANDTIKQIQKFYKIIGVFTWLTPPGSCRATTCRERELTLDHIHFCPHKDMDSIPDEESTQCLSHLRVVGPSSRLVFYDALNISGH